MIARAIACLLAMLAAGCRQTGDSQVKAIIGATLFDGTGRAPVADSIVVIAGSRIRAAGERTAVPVPEAAEIVDGAGLFIVPGLIDLDAPGDERSLAEALRHGVTGVRTAAALPDPLWQQARRPGQYLAGLPLALTAESARREAVEFAAHRADAFHLDAGVPAAAAEAVLAAARSEGIPATAAASSWTQVQWMVDHGAVGLTGMLRDEGEPDPVLLAHLRTLKIVVAPSLAHGDAVAMRNARRLVAAGVPLGLASGSADGAVRGLEHLVEAGLSPLEALLAATRNSAMALRLLDRVGTIQPGRRADLLLLGADPRTDVRSLRKLRRVMLNGRWAGR